MNRTPRFTPVDPMPMPDGTVVHSSARTFVGMAAHAVCTARLVMTVQDGELQVRYATVRRARARR